MTGRGNLFYKHQSRAIARFDKSSCIPLFFDPGLGKTRTIIEIATRKFLRGEIDTVLVIAPNRVHRQWAVEEIPKWCTVPYTVQICEVKNWQPKILNFICVNVDKFSTKGAWQQYIDCAIQNKTFIVVDEATRIKNPKAKRSQNIIYGFNSNIKKGKRIVASKPMTVCRAVLTGTPVTNSPFDIWSMFEFLSPGMLGMGWYTFQAKYGLFRTAVIGGRGVRMLIDKEAWYAIQRCEDFTTACIIFGVDQDTYWYIKQHGAYSGPFRNIEELKKLLYTYSEFASIDECLDLPEKMYVKRTVDMVPQQAKMYKSMRDNYIVELKDDIIGVTSKLAAVIKMQQIAAGFINDIPLDDNPKLERMMEDIEEIKGKKFIVVCHFVEESRMIFERLEKEGYKVCLQTGIARIGTIDDFKQGKYDCMVANIRCISTGLNLQDNCNVMFFYSNTHSYEDRLQTEGRIHRSGQTQRCVYYDYVMKGTVDEKILELLNNKKDMLEFIKTRNIEECI